jgi:hypothetical protein
MVDQLQRNVPFDDGFRAKPFVRVRQRRSPPRLWCWEIHFENAAYPLRASESTYHSAQDAWEAGQAALARATLNPIYQHRSRPAPAMPADER